MNIIIKDDTIGGKTKNRFSFQIEKDSCTLAELIRRRIDQEVAQYNEERPSYFNTLVQPSEAEVTLNGYQLKSGKMIDPEKQYYLALGAFKKNGFFVLINDDQKESLDEEIKLSDNMEMQFIKLTPLVGG